MEKFFATSVQTPISESWCEATCRKCYRELTLDRAQRLDEGNITVYRCPGCEHPLLRINRRERKLVFYTSGLSITVPAPG